MTENLTSGTRWQGVLGFATAYVALYHLSGFLIENQFFANAVSFLFLPAFIRLLGYLVIGLWITPALLLAGIVLILKGTYDLGAGIATELAVTLATAISGPALTHLAARLMQLKPNLETLSPSQLLALSVACSLGNALALGSTLWLMVPHSVERFLFTPIFLGDMLGTWLVIYTIKLLLELLIWMRSSASR
ncbi:MAG: hypothetical protein RLZZ415_789 [Pseudomonadota bacterium]|jgi:hypothetical protein